MKKVVKGGKKRKPAKAETTQAFDLEIISKNDLKTYITSLEKEFAQMRKDCALYSTNMERVMEFLASKRNDFKSQKEESIVNNTTMDDFIDQLRKFPVKSNEQAIIDDREASRQQKQTVFEEFLASSSVEEKPLDQANSLKQLDADRGLEANQFHHYMALAGTKECCQNAFENLNEKYHKRFENILLKKTDEFLKIRQEFSADKIKTLSSIWNVDEQREKTESYARDVKKIQDYFHEIAANNVEVAEILREKLAKLIIENKKIDFSLKQLLLENMELEDFLKPSYLPLTKTSVLPVKVSAKKDVQREKKLVAFQYRNDILAQYLLLAKEDLLSLKKQFFSATRRIYQKANFKAFIIEGQIQLAIQKESLDSPSEKEIEAEKHETAKLEPKNQTADDIVNLFKLSVENSDTLFVPPVYHEFWDPSVKCIK